MTLLYGIIIDKTIATTTTTITTTTTTEQMSNYNVESY